MVGRRPRTPKKRDGAGRRFHGPGSRTVAPSASAASCVCSAVSRWKGVVVRHVLFCVVFGRLKYRCTSRDCCRCHTAGSSENVYFSQVAQNNNNLLRNCEGYQACAIRYVLSAPCMWSGYDAQALILQLKALVHRMETTEYVPLPASFEIFIWSVPPRASAVRFVFVRVFFLVILHPPFVFTFDSTQAWWPVTPRVGGKESDGVVSNYVVVGQAPGLDLSLHQDDFSVLWQV